MLKFYAVEVDDRGELCCSVLEAKNPQHARVLVKTAWGKEIKILNVKEIPAFYQEQDAMTSEEQEELNAMRRANLLASRVKPVTTPEGEFPSFKEAVAALGITASQLRYKIQTQPTEYYIGVGSDNTNA